MRLRSRPLRRALPILGAWSVATAAVACGLQDGGIAAIAGSDAQAATDAPRIDGAFLGIDTGAAEAGDDAATPSDADADAGPAKDYVFAATASDLYSFEVHSGVLHDLGTFASCGVSASSYTSVDLAQDSNGLLHLLTWQMPQGAPPTAHFSYYAIEPDGGCVDVHGGPGTTANGAMWAGYQKVTGDTLYAVNANTKPLNSYSGTGNYLTSTGNLFPGPGAAADIACTPTVCYSALPSDRCPNGNGGNDCLFAFGSDGSNPTQLGDFAKAGVAGVAYQGGSVYGFCKDGSILQIGTAATAVAHAVTVFGASTTGLVWEGAASSSANE